MKRRQFITLLGGAAAWPQRALAQSGRRRIAVLMGLPAGDPLGQAEAAAFEQGLKDLGWTKTRNIQLEYRWPGSDIARLGAAAKELVAWNPDVIVARATPSVAAVRRETIVIPIVFPTGFTNFEPSLGGKWLELLKEMAPRVTRVAVLFNPDTAPFAQKFLQTIETTAPSFRIKPFTAPTRDIAGIEQAIAALAREPGGGLVQIPDSFTLAHRELLIGLAAKHRLPAVYSNNAFARSGALISYAVESSDVFRRAATYVDRILKGTRASELPVQQPTKFELVINLKTAKALGLNVPERLLALADEVIE